MCKLCRNLPPLAMGARSTVFGGKPVRRTRWMAGAAPHKGGCCWDKSRSDNTTQTVLICDICHKQIHGRKQISIICIADTHAPLHVTPLTSLLQIFIYLLETAHPRTAKQMTRTHNTTNSTSQACIPHSVSTGDVNEHCTLWHSYTDDSRGQLIEDVISNSDYITLKTDILTPHYNKISLLYITTMSYTLYNTHYHLPNITTKIYDMSTDCTKPNIHKLQESRLDTIYRGYKISICSNHDTHPYRHC